jgi:N6-L-threonylcarbamoyladenine synthase
LREVLRVRDSSAAPQNDNGLGEQTINDLAAGTQAAIVDVLVKKTMRAAKENVVKSILLSGGVAANQNLRETFQSEIEKRNVGVTLFVPPKNFCTDNAAMIAAAAYFNYNPIGWKELGVNPELYYE